jgi:hypothetical protein
MDFPAYPFDNDHPDYKHLWYMYHKNYLENYFKLVMFQYNKWKKTTTEICDMDDILHNIKHISNYAQLLKEYFHLHADEFLKLFPKDNEFHFIYDTNIAIRDILKQTNQIYHHIRRKYPHNSLLPRNIYIQQSGGWM